jgi:hypothetical protein
MQRGNHELLASSLIIAVLASQATIWHSLATIREAIQQTNAIVVAACGSGERPCQIAAHRGQIELGEIMLRPRATDGFACGLSRFNPGLGVTNDPTGENEITNGAVLELDLLPFNPLSLPTSFSIRMASTTTTSRGDPEGWQVFGSNSAGHVVGATLLASCTSGGPTDCEGLFSDI